jgi:hypothetical protein
MSGDQSGDMSDDGRWLTYAQLAASRGISKASAARLVLRKRWRRQRGNDRTVRILVPHDSLSADMTSDVSHDLSGDRALLAGALAALEGALAEANGKLSDALALADRTLTRLADADAATAILRTELDRVRADHQTAAQRLEEAEAADVARRSRNRLARLWAAWLGR